MTSPLLTPAFLAGVSGSGEITTSRSFLSPTSIPTPPKLPFISSLKILVSVGGKKTEYGSPSEETIPAIAPQTRSWSLSAAVVVAVLVELPLTNFWSITSQVFQKGEKSTSAGLAVSLFVKPVILLIAGWFSKPR